MISELLGLVNKALGLAIPLVEESVAQRYNYEELKRIKEYQEIWEENDPQKRRDYMGGFIMRLCVNAGTPIGRLSGSSIEVPVECFDALIRIAIDNEKKDKLLASATHTLRKQAD